MSPEDSDGESGSKLSPETILARLGATAEGLSRACRSLGLVRLGVFGPEIPDLAPGPDGRIEVPAVRVFATFADEPCPADAVTRLHAVRDLLRHVFNRSVSPASIEILEPHLDRNVRDRYFERLVTVFDATEPEPASGDAGGDREAQPLATGIVAKPARRVVDRRFAVRRRIDENGCLVVEIRYGKRASAVVSEAARIRKENTRNRWRGLAAADLDDDEGLLRRYGKRSVRPSRPKT